MRTTIIAVLMACVASAAPRDLFPPELRPWLPAARSGSFVDRWGEDACLPKLVFWAGLVASRHELRQMAGDSLRFGATPPKRPDLPRLPDGVQDAHLMPPVAAVAIGAEKSRVVTLDSLRVRQYLSSPSRDGLDHIPLIFHMSPWKGPPPLGIVLLLNRVAERVRASAIRTTTATRRRGPAVITITTVDLDADGQADVVRLKREIQAGPCSEGDECDEPDYFMGACKGGRWWVTSMVVRGHDEWQGY